MHRCVGPQSTDLMLIPALTDALIAGLANGQTAYKLIGRYIASPLRWCGVPLPWCRHGYGANNRAIITGKESKYNTVDDLKGTTFGISRLGSGSQVMASVLSLQEGWTEEEQPKFKVNGQFKPLRDSVNSEESAYGTCSMRPRAHTSIGLPMGVVHD